MDNPHPTPFKMGEVQRLNGRGLGIPGWAHLWSGWTPLLCRELGILA